jgi:hypothetical protein
VATSLFVARPAPGNRARNYQELRKYLLNKLEPGGDQVPISGSTRFLSVRENPPILQGESLGRLGVALEGETQLYP